MKILSVVMIVAMVNTLALDAATSPKATRAEIAQNFDIICRSLEFQIAEIQASGRELSCDEQTELREKITLLARMQADREAFLSFIAAVNSH